jgi:hypothetical protein
MVASLRFNDPLFVTIWPSLLESRDLRNDVGEDSATSRVRLRRLTGLTEMGLVAPRALFSCPDASITEAKGIAGSELPLSGAMLSALFRGLLGDARARVNGLEGDVLPALAERNESLTLGRKGVKAVECGAPLM